MSFGPNYARKRQKMGPGGRLSCFDNVPQDGVSAGATEAANSYRHLASNARPCYFPVFAVS